ncbi:signal peptidase [Chryseobacterium taeanense]|uniref:signal peptidase n=1 Tax=Chryseobacterium taeanense TaxID=311334 RepID=UPI0035AFFE82
MKAINKFIPVFFLFGFQLIINAQDKVPPPNSNNPTAKGVVGPGTPSSPIDMYIYILGIVAIMLIIFFSKKYTPKKI